ncbi:hypothetical protein GCM10020331_003970 [Ectobacillus funiculus]
MPTLGQTALMRPLPKTNGIFNPQYDLDRMTESMIENLAKNWAFHLGNLYWFKKKE